MTKAFANLIAAVFHKGGQGTRRGDPGRPTEDINNAG